MDIAHFFKNRLEFVHYFYKQACTPFQETIYCIEHEQPPFMPKDGEFDEPQFIFEWIQAQEGLISVGHATISMLSSALKMYMNAWLDRTLPPRKKVKTRKGWINDLKKEMISYGVDFDTCPIDLDNLEQMVLARNRVQHADNITSNIVNHDPKQLKQFPSPIFIDSSNDIESDWFIAPKVYVNKDIVEGMIALLDSFSSWLESEHERLVHHP